MFVLVWVPVGLMLLFHNCKYGAGASCFQLYEGMLRQVVSIGPGES